MLDLTPGVRREAIAAGTVLRQKTEQVGQELLFDPFELRRAALAVLRVLFSLRLSDSANGVFKGAGLLPRWDGPCRIGEVVYVPLPIDGIPTKYFRGEK
ncbi:hypothetical protein UB46_20790 [Burkholderiaceae bacterium 16]|nr:hypothetical protein UB46_20790 [Burkholderiaceae bacterium 16]